MNRKYLALAISLCVLLAAALAAGCGASGPSLSSLTPTSGATGSDVVITGQSFGKTQGSGTVKFGSSKPDIRSWSDTTITIMVPRDLKDGDYPITVTTGAGTSNQLTFTIKTTTSKTPTQPTTPTLPSQKNTPQDTITQYMQSQGGNITDYVLKATKASQSDPTWAIDDYQRFEGMGHQLFLLHQVNGLWTVVTVQANPFDPQTYGAPADLTYP
jgi:hypothetical protein